jgi:hypothetical protein
MTPPFYVVIDDAIHFAPSLFEHGGGVRERQAGIGGEGFNSVVGGAQGFARIGMRERASEAYGPDGLWIVSDQFDGRWRHPRIAVTKEATEPGLRGDHIRFWDILAHAHDDDYFLRHFQEGYHGAIIGGIAMV